MQLADRDLRGLLPEMNIVTPGYAPAFNVERQVQPASIDLRIDRVCWKRQPYRRPIDLTNKLSTRFSSRTTYKSDLGPRGKYRLRPNDVVMTRTLEQFTVPEGYSAEIFTRSSFGRLGLSITCAGYINPGYRGHMPLQIKNIGKDTIVLQPLAAVCQLVIKQLSGSPDRAYGDTDLRSKYANDEGGPSRWWEDIIVKDTQESLGATNMPEEAQEQLLTFILARDISTQDRFSRFLTKAKAVDLETYDSALDAFARQEARSMAWLNFTSVVGAGVAVLIGASLGAIFSTPFNEEKYGLPHIALWAVTVICSLAYAPVLYRKLTARETDFVLPREVDAIRVRS